MAVFAVLYTYDERSGDRDTHRPAHRAFLADLETAGVLLAAGAYSDEGEPGALLIVRSESPAEVTAILAKDPFVLQDLVPGVEIREWSAGFGPWA